MPSNAVIAALLIALALAGLKLAGVSAHLPPNAVPADILAQNRERAFALRAEPGSEQVIAQPHQRAVSADARPAKYARLMTLNAQ
jgi:hypothetical protein